MKHQGRMPALCAGQRWAPWSTPSTREKQKEKGEKGEIIGSGKTLHKRFKSVHELNKCLEKHNYQLN